MTPKTALYLGVAAAVLLALGWQQLDTAAVRGLLRDSAAPVVPAVTRAAEVIEDSVRAPDRAAAPTQAQQAPAGRISGVAGVRKCVRGGEVVYTSESCPPGHAEQTMQRGTVNVVTATPLPRPAASAERTGTIRDLAVTPGEPTLMDKHIERATRQ